MKYWPFIFLFALGTISCNDSNKSTAPTAEDEGVGVKITGPTQGTTYAITYLGSTVNYQNSIDSLLKDFDQDISLWVEGSLINRINAHNRRDTTFSFVDSTKYFSVLFSLSREIYRKTNGAFDPSVLPLVREWGFGKEGKKDADLTKIDSIRNSTGFDELSIDMIENTRDMYHYINTDIFKGKPGTQIDFNAIAQGYSVDLVGRFLEEKGISNYMVEIGGEVLCKGKNQFDKFWKIAIEDPEGEVKEKKEKAHIILENKAIATSGSYRQFYIKDGIRYSHTINPVTGRPVEHSLLSVSVLANSCAEADAYATAFMVMGVDGILNFLGDYPDLDLDVYFIFDDNGTITTGMTPTMNEIMTEL